MVITTHTALPSMIHTNTSGPVSRLCAPLDRNTCPHPPPRPRFHVSRVPMFMLSQICNETSHMLYATQEGPKLLSRRRLSPNSNGSRISPLDVSDVLNLAFCSCLDSAVEVFCSRRSRRKNSCEASLAGLRRPLFALKALCTVECATCGLVKCIQVLAWVKEG